MCLHGDDGSSLLETNVYRPIGQQGSSPVLIDMDLVEVGSGPIGLRCPRCQEDVMTRVNYVISRRTHTLAIVLGVLFWWLCCCALPYLLRSCKDVEHYCPSCDRYLGLYTRPPLLRRCLPTSII